MKKKLGRQFLFSIFILYSSLGHAGLLSQLLKSITKQFDAEPLFKVIPAPDVPLKPKEPDLAKIDIYKNLQNKYLLDSKIADSNNKQIIPEISNLSIEACSRQEWKQDVREKLEDYSWLEKAFFSNTPEKYVKEGVFKAINDKLKIQLNYIVPITVGVEIDSHNLIVSIDTPCGSDRFMKNKFLFNSNGVKRIELSKSQVSKIRKKIIGKWISTYQVKIAEPNIYQTVVSIDMYSSAGTIQSAVVTSIRQNETELVNCRVALSGKWKVLDDMLVITLTKITTLGYKSKLNSITQNDFEQAYKEALLTNINSKILMLFNEDMITKDLESGIIEKAKKINNVG